MANHRGTAGFSLGYLLLTAPLRVLGVHFSLRALAVFRDTHSCNEEWPLQEADTSACRLCWVAKLLTLAAPQHGQGAMHSPEHQCSIFPRGAVDVVGPLIEWGLFSCFPQFLPLCPHFTSLSTSSQCEGPYTYCTGGLQRTQLEVVSLLRNVKTISQVVIIFFKHFLSFFFPYISLKHFLILFPHL